MIIIRPAMTEAEEFIYHFEGDQRQVLLYFHRLLASDLNLTVKMRYDLPFYYGASWICYLHPTPKGQVELTFSRGNELSNEQELLESRGRKQVSSAVFGTLAEVRNSPIEEVIQEAILLDETRPYASKRRPHNG